MPALSRRFLDGSRRIPRYAATIPRSPRLSVTLPPLDSPRWHGPLRAFAWGLSAITQTILTVVLFVTYLGIGALGHDTHFSLAWTLASTLFVWAGPAQIILITTLGSGATILQAAIAVTVSAVRLFPMVVSVLPLMRTPKTRRRELIFAAHLTAVTLWVECHRFLPQVPRERRIAFVHGLGCGLVSVCLCANTIGYFLAAGLTQTLGAAILLLTPLSFLFSTARNSREIADIVALVLGLLLYPLAAKMHSGLDILVSGLVAGTVAYGVHVLREVRA